MGRYANKYIPTLYKKLRTDRNQTGWVLRTKDNEGQIRYKNDTYEFVYNDTSIITLNKTGLLLPSDITFTANGGILTWDGVYLTTSTGETVAYISDLPTVPENITTQGNTFNGANQLVQLDALADVPDANLSANVTIQGNTFNGIDELVQLDGSGRLPSLDGSQLTNMVTGGTIQNANLSIQAADEGVVTGNTRGRNSVDLQTNRTYDTQIASGDYSGVLGGSTNTASGDYSVVFGGLSNTASGNYSIVAGGATNTASGLYNTVGGGDLNYATGQSYATVSGGYSNVASGVRATIGGGYDNTASGSQATIPGGVANTAATFSEVVVGCFASEVSGNASSYISTDPLFRVGNGTGPSTLSDAMRLDKDGSAYLYSLKSGATQVAAGASSGELWYTVSHATLPDNVLMVGV